MVRNEKLQSQIIGTANRLRMIQVDFADEGEDVQHEYLCDEIKRALTKVLPEDRTEFLERTCERFPIGVGHRAVPEMPSGESQAESRFDEQKLNDPDFLVDLLIKVFSSQSQERQDIIVRKLSEGGLAPANVSEGLDNAAESFRTGLKIEGGSQLDSDRVFRLLLTLAGFVVTLEPIIWDTWAKLAPRSKIRPTRLTRKTFGKFVIEDSGISQEQLTAEFGRLRQMIAALITAFGRAGDRFARHFLSTYAPSQISALVKMGKSNFLVSHDAACWQQYRDLAGGLTSESIEGQIRKALVEYAEPLMERHRKK